MKKIVKVILIVALVAAVALAHPYHGRLKFRPFQVSFAYPLSTNGFDALKYENGISFNILYGINGALSGWEVAGLFNYNHQHANGFQVAGLANVCGGEQKGFQVAGLMNYNDDDSYGFQVGGLFNFNRRDRYGASIAGVMNYVGDEAKGFNAAGVMNLVPTGYYEGSMLGGAFNLVFDDIDGFMLAGAVNAVGGSIYGFQLAPVNIVGTDMGGVQIGVLNHAKAIEGFQLGVINYAGRDDGLIPLGVMSIVKDGYYELEFNMDEISVANMKYKMGVEKLYNIYSAGLMYYKDQLILRYGLGLGTLKHLGGPHYLSAEIGSEHIVHLWSWGFSPNLLSAVDLTYKFRLAENIGLFIGPSLNVLLSGYYGISSDSHLIRLGEVIYSYEWPNTDLNIWPGLNFGFSLIL